MTSQIISPSGASAGIGFAVSSNTLRRVVPRLIAVGYFPHPWLGAQMLSLTQYTAEMLREAGMKLSVNSGVLILSTVTGGPAEQAGIKGGSRLMRVGRYRVPIGGDVIVAVDGKPVNSLQELTVYLETKTAIGDTVQLTIIREGKELLIPVKLAEQPRGS